MKKKTNESLLSLSLSFGWDSKYPTNGSLLPALSLSLSLPNVSNHNVKRREKKEEKKEEKKREEEEEEEEEKRWSSATLNKAETNSLCNNEIAVNFTNAYSCAC